MSETDNRELRNAMLAAQMASQNPGSGEGQPITAQQYARQELGVEITVDAVPLPSKGKVYPQGHPLCGAQSVEYRAMTAKEEDILMSQALIKRGTVITELIKSFIVLRSYIKTFSLNFICISPFSSCSFETLI